MSNERSAENERSAIMNGQIGIHHMEILWQIDVDCNSTASPKGRRVQIDEIALLLGSQNRERLGFVRKVEGRAAQP